MDVQHLPLPIQVGARKREKLTGAHPGEEGGPAHGAVSRRYGAHEGADLVRRDRAALRWRAYGVQPGIVWPNPDSVGGVRVEELNIDGVAEHRREGGESSVDRLLGEARLQELGLDVP